MLLSVDPHLLWGTFLALLAGSLAIDLWAHRRPPAPGAGLGSAVRWTAAWICLAIACAVAAWPLRGPQASLQYLASYAVEWSLSADNVLVLTGLVVSLAVPDGHRYRVLFFGSLGAIVLRLSSIVAGTALLDRFAWLGYAFGFLLLVLAARLALDGAGRAGRGTGRRARRCPVVTWSQRPATLLVAVAALMFADLAFAADSVPAVLALTRDPLVAFSSNAMAVLGLRSLAVVLQGVVGRLRYLQPALALVLTFVGVRMIASPYVDVPVASVLLVTIFITAAAVVASLVSPPRRRDYAGVAVTPGERAADAPSNGPGVG